MRRECSFCLGYNYIRVSVDTSQHHIVNYVEILHDLGVTDAFTSICLKSHILLALSKFVTVEYILSLKCNASDGIRSCDVLHCKPTLFHLR